MNFWREDTIKTLENLGLNWEIIGLQTETLSEGQ